MELRKLVRLDVFLSAALMVLFASQAGELLAHHGWTGYESSKTLTLSGTVKTSAYENPHSFVDLEVDGKLWHVILAPPSRMQARGLSREMLKTGTKATVVGYPHKTDSSELRAERITIGKQTTELR